MKRCWSKVQRTKKQCNCPVKFFNEKLNIFTCGRHKRKLKRKCANINLNEIPNKKQKTKRKNMEHAPHELLFPLQILNNYLKLDYNLITNKNIDNINEKCKNYIKCDKLEYFITNLKTYLNEEKTHSNKWQTSAYREIKNNKTIFQNIKCIYIVGKNEKDFPNILKLNKYIDPNDKKEKKYDTKEAKADIYIENKKSQFIGISIKKSKDSTKTNWSVYKLINIYTEKNINENMKKIFNKMLNNNNEIIDISDKKNREIINKLLYPIKQLNENGLKFELCPYYKELNDKIINKKVELCKQFENLFYSKNVCYPIYEFNGEKMEYLNDGLKYNFELFDYTNEICNKFYYYKNNKQNEVKTLRETAKLFYYLEITHDKKAKKKYRIEVRFKGSFCCSPQFQFHEIH